MIQPTMDIGCLQFGNSAVHCFLRLLQRFQRNAMTKVSAIANTTHASSKPLPLKELCHRDIVPRICSQHSHKQ
jgi:hypothetical protein